MKKIISLLHLRLSDLFLVVGLVPMVFFLMYGQEFMQKVDPNDVPLKITAIIPLFVLLVLSWGVYIFLEYRRGNKFNKYISITFLLLAVIGIIGIVIQPSHVAFNMITNNGETFLIELDISPTHYAFFSMDIVVILFLIYVGLFILPKRFSNILFVQWIGYLVIIGCFALNIYSYIVEHDCYSSIIKAVLDGELGLIGEYAVKSFIIHKNAFGMTLFIGIICCIINHSIGKNGWYFFFIFYFLISMIFTFCKTSILLSVVIILIYIYYCLLSANKNDKKIRVFSVLLLTILLLSLAGFVAIVILDKGVHFAKLYNALSSILENNTINSREWIWSNTYQLITNKMPLSLLFGRGFGIINEMLLPMNLVNGDSPLSFPTHNGFLNLFAEGGFLYLFAYLALLGYASYIAIKSYKKNPSTTLAIALGLFSFVFYSLIETIHYLTYVFMFVLFAFYNTQLNVKEEE